VDVLKKKIILFTVAVAMLFILNKYNVFSIFSFENINELKIYISSFGIWSPMVFIVIFAVSTVLFVPGLPVTVLSGILFGAFWGTIYVVVGSTIGVSASFLIGRYLGRDFVKRMTEKNKKMAKLDNYIKEHGDTILIISRLIPLFPFNLQNYAYGITDIRFSTYFWYSLIFMIPGTFIYTSFGALAYSSIPIEKLVLYSGMLLTALCFLIILPRKIFNIPGN
jgi:uncharacterized membrane protein YdjX (TVP38/TMEM64 family)